MSRFHKVVFFSLSLAACSKASSTADVAAQASEVAAQAGDVAELAIDVTVDAPDAVSAADAPSAVTP